jgi:hypothetical protein
MQYTPHSLLNFWGPPRLKRTGKGADVLSCMREDTDVMKCLTLLSGGFPRES